MQVNADNYFSQYKIYLDMSVYQVSVLELLGRQTQLLLLVSLSITDFPEYT